MWLKPNYFFIQFAKCLPIVVLFPVHVFVSGISEVPGTVPGGAGLSVSHGLLSEREKSSQEKPLLLYTLEMQADPSEIHSSILRSVKVHL